MAELVRAYGRGLAAVFAGLTALWLAVMIALPMANMTKRAFTLEIRDGPSAQMGVELQRARQAVAVIDFDIAAAEREIERGAAPAAAPSSSDPFAGLTGRASPGMAAPSPGAGASEPPEARLERLRAERAEAEAAIPAMAADVARLRAEEDARAGLSAENFTTMSPLHWRVFGLTFLYCVAVTALSLIVCYPVAYAVAQAQGTARAGVLLLGLVVPYAINELLRIFAWTMILANNGILNGALDALGVIDLESGETIRWLASNGSVFAVMVYAYVLFMVFPIYNAIETLERAQIEAARDLGASVWRIHRRVVIPHAKPGIAVGCIMTFMLSAGSISVPGLVGPGLHPDWFSQIIYRNFFEAANWNVGSARALLLLILSTAFIIGVMRAFGVGVKEIAK